MWLVSFSLDKPSGCGEALMQAHTQSGCAMHGLLESNSNWLLLEPAISGYGGSGAFGVGAPMRRQMSAMLGAAVLTLHRVCNLCIVW